MYFGGKPAPALPIQGYCDIPKLQCPLLDPKPCTPSNKKSTSGPSKWTITCKPSKSNPYDTPRSKSLYCGSIEKKRSCDLNLRSSSVTAQTKFDVSYPKKSLLNSQLTYIFEYDPSMELSEKGCQLLLENFVKQYLSSLYSNGRGPCPPSKRCPSRIDKRRGSSCPPPSECPKPSCPPPFEGPKSRCPPPSETPKPRCPPSKKCPGHGDKGDGGSYPPKICAPNTGGSCAPPPQSFKKSKTGKGFPPKCNEIKKIKKPKKRPPVCPPRKKAKPCHKRPAKKKVQCGPRQSEKLRRRPRIIKKHECIPLIKGKVYHGPVCPGRKVTGCANPVVPPVQPRCPPKSRQEKRKREAPLCPPRVKDPPKKK